MSNAGDFPGVEFVRILFRFKNRKENSSSFVHVLQITWCRAVVLIIKTIVLLQSSLWSSSKLLKLSIIESEKLIQVQKQEGKFVVVCSRPPDYVMQSCCFNHWNYYFFEVVVVVVVEKSEKLPTKATTNDNLVHILHLYFKYTMHCIKIVWSCSTVRPLCNQRSVKYGTEILFLRRWFDFWSGPCVPLLWEWNWIDTVPC